MQSGSDDWVRPSPTAECACREGFSLVFTFPKPQFFFRKRVEKGIRYLDSRIGENAEALWALGLDRFNTRNRLFSPPGGDDHGFSLLCLFDQFREVGFGFEDGCCNHLYVLLSYFS